MRTWKSLAWINEPKDKSSIVLVCEGCGNESRCETALHGPVVIAAIGLRIVVDPPGAEVPDNFLPDEIQCRHCRRIYSSLVHQTLSPS